MKNKVIVLSLLIASTLFINSCKRYNQPGENIQTVEETKLDIGESEALLDFINNSGDFINTKAFPTMVSAADVYDNQSSYFIIDIRSPEDYVKGHINGAINIATNHIMAYLDEFVSASIYDKLVIVDKNGLEASFVTSTLRLIGYNNVYAMKYGMGSWNRKLDKFSENISSKYTNRLSSKGTGKDKKYPFPQIETGEHCGAEILEARANTVLNTPFDRLTISADRIFNNPDEFYVINYFPKERYDLGHIPQARQYTPGEDLKVSSYLNTLSPDKKIVFYAYTGQTSAFIMAYLRLLGYNAFIIPNGASSFMYSKLVSNNLYSFNASEKLNDFVLVKGEKPRLIDFSNQIIKIDNGSAKPKKKIKRRKKKEVEGGCS